MTTLIRVPTLTNKNNWMQGSLPPIGLAYLAASLKRAGHNPRVIDAVGEGITQYSLFEKIRASREIAFSIIFKNLS